MGSVCDLCERTATTRKCLIPWSTSPQAGLNFLEPGRWLGWKDITQWLHTVCLRLMSSLMKWLDTQKQNCQAKEKSKRTLWVVRQSWDQWDQSDIARKYRSNCGVHHLTVYRRWRVAYTVVQLIWSALLHSKKMWILRGRSTKNGYLKKKKSKWSTHSTRTE